MNEFEKPVGDEVWKVLCRKAMVLTWGEVSRNVHCQVEYQTRAEVKAQIENPCSLIVTEIEDFFV